MRQSDRVERMKRVSTRRRYVSLAASAVFRFNNSTLQRLRSNGQAFNPWHAIVRRLPDDGGTGESLHMPGQRAGYSRSLFRHGLGRGCGVGRGLGNGVDLGVPVAVGVCRRRTRCYRGGGRCSCRTRSWRYTGCWCWTGQARTNHVNKTSDDLLVPLVGFARR